MNKLPLEIEDEIWKLYWMDIYTTNCINLLKNEEFKMKKLDFFVKKHVYPCNSNKYLLQIKYYLIKYNDYLKQNKNNRGLILFFKRFIKNFDSIYSSTYLNNTYKNINDELKYIAIYCILYGTPYMTYYTIEKFKFLSNN
jgi:hypothetical protein